MSAEELPLTYFFGGIVMAWNRRCTCPCCFPSIAEIMERCGCVGGIVAQRVCCDQIRARGCGCNPCGCRKHRCG